MQCLICSAPLSLALDVGRSVAVTSDCRVVEDQVRVFRCGACSTLQKIPSPSYLSRVDEIYKGYRIYELSVGREQVKFQVGLPRARSDIIIENVLDDIPHGGDFLDIGTGSGVFLKAVNKRFGGRVKLYAHDVTVATRDALVRDLPIEQFYVGDLAQIERRFDLISMVHVLEHVPSPLRALEQVDRLLKDDGVLLVQVPDLEETVFDVVIFDHVCHFSESTLLALLGKVFPRCAMPHAKISNEITALAGRNARRLEQRRHATVPPARIDLSKVSKVTDLLSGTSERMAVFGIAPAGTFCGALLGDRLQCFVDEDTNVQFKRHLGRLILPPDQIDPDVCVFLPQSKNSASIQSRLKRIRFVTETDS